MGVRIAIETWPFAPAFDDFDADVAREIAALGADGVVCQLGTDFPPRDPRTVTENECRRVRGLLDDAGLPVAYSWGFWSALVHADPTARREAVERSAAALRIAHSLGAPCVVSGAGSNSTEHGWYPHPENFTAASLERLTESAAELAPMAEELGVIFVLKGATLSTLGTPEDVRSVIDTVGSPFIRGGLDPVNWMRLEHVWDSAAFIDRICDVLGDDLQIAHAKDFVLDPDLILHIREVPVGEGWLDHVSLIRAYAERKPDGWIALEHAPRDKVEAALAHLRAAVRTAESNPAIARGQR